MNVAKSKVMRYARACIVGEMDIMMNGQVLEKVAVFKYLGSLVTAVGWNGGRCTAVSFGGE